MEQVRVRRVPSTRSELPDYVDLSLEIPARLLYPEDVRPLIDAFCSAAHDRGLVVDQWFDHDRLLDVYTVWGVPERSVADLATLESAHAAVGDRLLPQG